MFDREWCLLSVRCEKDLGVFVKVQGLKKKLQGLFVKHFSVFCRIFSELS